MLWRNVGNVFCGSLWWLLEELPISFFSLVSSFQSHRFWRLRGFCSLCGPGLPALQWCLLHRGPGLFQATPFIILHRQRRRSSEGGVNEGHTGRLAGGEEQLARCPGWWRCPLVFLVFTFIWSDPWLACSPDPSSGDADPDIWFAGDARVVPGDPRPAEGAVHHRAGQQQHCGHAGRDLPCLQGWVLSPAHVKSKQVEE